MKKIFLMMIAVLAVSLAGCGDEEKKTTSTPFPTAISTQYDEASTAIYELFDQFDSSLGAPLPSQLSSMSKELKSREVLAATSSSSGSGTFTDTNGYFKVVYSYDSASYNYVLTVLKDYTSTTGIIIKAGGTETLKGTYSYTSTVYKDNYTDIADFKYVKSGVTHSFGWNIAISDNMTYNQTTGAYSGTIEWSGTITFDSASYTFNESENYSF